MNQKLKHIIETELENIREKGLFKEERIIASRQGREIIVGKKKYLNFCSNNYLGLAGRKELIAAGKKALEKWGFGLASVRFICGTQQVHKQLEQKIAAFLGFEDAILYSSCFDANTGLFQAILTPEDAIISDELNHASLIDGIRLCKAERFVYKNSDMPDLEEKLKMVQRKRVRMIVTDGVFSMEGAIAKLDEVAVLAEKYGALLVVDDSHATGFMGNTGRGTPEMFKVTKKIDFLTGTFGKALGGASGGFIASTKENVSFLRQKSRNYLFSNSLAPVIAGVNLFAIDFIKKHPELRKMLWSNVRLFKKLMLKAGFEVSPQDHPIVPVMLGDAKLAKTMASELFKQGIYVIGFSYPVVPEGKARIRVQLSALHTSQDIKRVVREFARARDKLKT